MTPLNKVLGLELSCICNITISWWMTYFLLSDEPTTFGFGKVRFPPGFLKTIMYALASTPAVPVLTASIDRNIPLTVDPCSTNAVEARVDDSTLFIRIVSTAVFSGVANWESTTCLIRFTGRIPRPLRLNTITR